MNNTLVDQAFAAQNAHNQTTRYIHAYQNTLVQWTDTEGISYIGTYLEFLASRA